MILLKSAILAKISMISKSQISNESEQLMQLVLSTSTIKLLCICLIIV